jgi:hypothetical protein
MRRVALTAVPVPPSMRPRWGRVTATDWHRHLRRTGHEFVVFFEGVDVSTRCVMADDVEGVATLLVLDENGNALLAEDRSGPAVQVVRGDVEIIERGVA